MPFSKNSLQTARLAVLAGSLVVGAVASMAWAGGASGTSNGPSQLERYVRLGSRLGTEALSRDLNLEHPAGTSLVSLMARLERAGFICLPDPAQYTGYDCAWRHAVSERRVALIKAHIEAKGVQVVSIEPLVSVYLR
jgi:hypothetical protein